MIPDKKIEELLQQHAAAKQSGLLDDTSNGGVLNAAERDRLSVELQRWAGPAESKKNLSHPQAPPLVPVRVLLPMAVAVTLLAVVVGIWAWIDRTKPEPNEAPENTKSIASQDDQQNQRQDDQQHQESPEKFLNGRGRVVAVGDDTRFTITDAASGRVRLEHGEVYVEITGDEKHSGQQAQIETPIGTAKALGTRFYVHYEDKPQLQVSPFLAVAVLAGLVEVTNSHGSEIAAAGEVVVAKKDSAPQPESAQLPERRKDDWGYKKTLRLVYWPQVQSALKLSDEQKSKLREPWRDERKTIGMIFMGLYRLSSDERSKKIAEFRDAQRKRITDILSSDQRERLWQIGLQYEGFFALARPEVADALQLSDGQRQQIDTVVERFDAAHHNLYRRNKGYRDWSELYQKKIELRQQTSQELSALLSDAQKQQWKSLIGPEVSLDKVQHHSKRSVWKSGNSQSGKGHRSWSWSSFGRRGRAGSLLEDERVAEKLKLTDEQKQNIKSLRDQSKKSLRDLFQGIRSGTVKGNEIREKFNQLREQSKQIDQTLLEVLTQEQRDEFKKIEAEKSQSRRARYRHGRGREDPGQSKKKH